MNILHRYHLIPAVAFLVGAAAGSIVASVYAKSLESASETELQSIAGSQDGQLETEAEASHEHRGPPASALSVSESESSPIQPRADDSRQDLETRLQAMTTAWTRLESELERLQGRVNGLEQRLTATRETPGAAGAETARRTSRPSTPEQRRSALVNAGLGEERAAEIVLRQGQQALDRLDLRDIAIREGWFGTDRYREELGLIEETAFDLRVEIGEDYYDRYLFAAGQDNRVEIASIIPGSAAEDSGLLPGDLVEAYGESRIFNYGDLRSATTGGERDELVPVRIRRGDDILDVWLLRGPMGVSLESTSMDPDA